jgi:tRNA-dihydrouridine synthase
VVGNGDVDSLADYLDMKRETGCDAVMIGRACRGNPWLFRDVLAAEEGRPIPDPPTVSDRRSAWRRHADLEIEYASPKMRVHELRKTLAWYSRGLFAGSELRRRAFAEMNPVALVDLGEAFFARLAERDARCGHDIAEPPDEAVKKSVDRHARNSESEEHEPCNA